MAELTRGNVTDRPWGRTFATLGLRGVTGQLTLFAEGKCFLVAFERGAVVAAMSPLASDAAARVALTAHLVSSSQVPEISRRQAAAPERDEIEVIAELARLGPEHALRLRRRAIAQRAARTFSIAQGQFIVTDQPELPIAAGCELDVRAVTYLGARANLAEQRLSVELEQLGTWFRLTPAADDDLPQFGFTDVEQPVIERLRDGGTLDDLEAFAASFIDARTVRAVVYALAVTNACEIRREPTATGSRRRMTGSANAPAIAASQPLPRTMPMATAPPPPLSSVAAARAQTQSIRPPARPTPGPTANSSEPRGAPRPTPGSSMGMAPIASYLDPPTDREPGIPGSPDLPRSPDDSARQRAVAMRRLGSDPPMQATPDAADPPRARNGSAGAPPLPPEEASSRGRGLTVDPAARARRDSESVPSRPRGADSDPLLPRARRESDPLRPARETLPPRDGAEPLDRSGEGDASGSAPRRRIPSSLPPRSRPASRTDSPMAHDVKALIAQRLKLLEQGADHFALLGVPHDVSAEALRRAYFALARQLHPDRLAALGISDDGKHAQRLFAQINTGFAVLSDADRRAEYLGIVRKGGEAAIRAEQHRAEQLARRIVDAEEAFHRGELALKRDQPQAAIADLERAVQLNPEEADYHALLAWSKFCAAPDKAAVAAATRIALDKAIQRSPKAVTARFYLGRVERMLGRDTDAIRHLREVLDASPHHGEAASELRVIEARIAADRGGKPGRR